MKKSKLNLGIPGYWQGWLGSPWNLAFSMPSLATSRPCHRSAHDQTCPWTSWHPQRWNVIAQCCEFCESKYTNYTNYTMTFPEDFGYLAVKVATEWLVPWEVSTAHSPSLAARGALTGACRGVWFLERVIFIQRPQDISPPVSSSILHINACILWLRCPSNNHSTDCTMAKTANCRSGAHMGK